MITSGDRILAVMVGTRRIPPPDVITVLLLPPSYHVPEFSAKSIPYTFIVEVAAFHHLWFLCWHYLKIKIIFVY